MSKAPSASPPTTPDGFGGGDGGDPSHMDAFQDRIVATWRDTPSVVGKASMVAQLMVLNVIDGLFRLKNLLRRGPTGAMQVGDVLVLEPGRIFSVEYGMGGHTSNCVLVKGMARAANELLVRSPCPLTPKVKEVVDQMGRPTVILASVLHDTFAHEWKQAYPEAKVMCRAGDRAIVRNRVPVDLVTEESRDLLLRMFGVREEPVSCFRFAESFLFVEGLMSPSSSSSSSSNTGADCAVVMPCGYCNNPVWSWTNPLSWARGLQGTARLGMPRMFAWFFCRDCHAASQDWDKVCLTPGLRLAVFLHGPSIRGHERILRDMRGAGRDAVAGARGWM